MADDAGFGTCVQCGGPGATGAIPGAWVHVDPVGCVSRLRTTLARLTADLAAVTAERDMWRGECASISAELDLPPGMRPAEGELRRMLGHNRALLAQVTTLTAERDEARDQRDASFEDARSLNECLERADTTRREWEVRAATSYRDGRAAGLREGFDIARDHAWISTHDGWNHTAPCIDWEHAEKRLALALAQPAAETVRTETIFGCRTCPASTPGWTDGRFASPGWGRIDHIDGPNAICPVCAADPTSLDCLREEYPDVTPAAEPRDEGES